MKKLSIILIIVVLVLTAIAPVLAEDGEHLCPHDGATITALQHCIEHAVQMGHVSGSVAPSLFAKLDAAQAAYNEGRNATAVNILQALTNEVAALSGPQIDPVHAAHIIQHTQAVIAALS